MLLPVTVHGRVSDIWRSYFTQALLPSVDAVVAFAPPWVAQVKPCREQAISVTPENLGIYYNNKYLVFAAVLQFGCPNALNIADYYHHKKDGFTFYPERYDNLTSIFAFSAGSTVAKLASLAPNTTRELSDIVVPL